MRNLILAILVLGFWRSATALMINADVQALDGRNCRAQLRMPEGVGIVPILFLQNGTGIRTMFRDSELPTPATELFAKKKLAILTFDKPGVHFDGENISVDDAVFNQHTQKDLIACAVRSMLWSQEQYHGNSPQIFYMLGHSEGAEIAPRALHYLLVRHPNLAKQVKMLLLNGIPMEDWRVMITRELRDPSSIATFWKSYELHDDNELRKLEEVPYAYLKDIFSTESPRETFEAMARMSPSPSFQFFQGLEDENTLAKKVLGFEKWNNEQKDLDFPSLDLTTHYYHANHDLNSAAMSDMMTVIEKSLAP